MIDGLDKYLTNEPMTNDVSDGRYKIILADPAWSYDDKSLERGGAERHYRTMSTKEICSLPVKDISDDDCALFMWATFPKIAEALEVIKEWGFEYKTCAFVWVKTNKRTDPNQTSFLPTESFDSFWGMGRWTRSNAEICLLAVKGKPKRLKADVHQIIYAPIDKHSKKPPETRDRIIKLIGDLSRVELFARTQTEGWDVWGNEVDNSITL